MREARQEQTAAVGAHDTVKSSVRIAANIDRASGTANLDALPTLPFDGSQLRTAVRVRIVQQTSPPLVPTRDSEPPPMILAEEPLPMEPLPMEPLPMEPLLRRRPRSAPPQRRLRASSQSLSLQGSVLSAELPASRLPPPSPGSPRHGSHADALDAPVDAMSLAIGFRRAPSRSLSEGGRDLSHPARARNPALGRPPARATVPPPAPAQRPPQTATALDLHGPVVRLADLPAVMQAPARPQVRGTAHRAAQSERRTTLLMLTAIAALLVSLMALLR